MIKSILVFLFVIMSTTFGWAQDISLRSLSWTVSGLTDKNTSEELSRPSLFESSPTAIKWIQKGGLFVYEFSVIGSSGSWTNTSVEGEFTYRVTFRGNPGTITFKRQANGVLIEPDIQKNNVNLFPYAFHVSSINTR